MSKIFIPRHSANEKIILIESEMNPANVETDGKNPLVTVVVTTFNRLTLCKRALKSVESQTYEPLEIIVVEDGSDTGIEDWVAEIKMDISYIKHNSNRGLAAARNTGITKSSGDYIAFLDDDDVWKSKKIEKQMKELWSVQREQRGKIGAIYCFQERRNKTDEEIKTVTSLNDGNLKESIIQKGPVTVASSYLFPKEVLLSIEGFDESLPSSIDHDIWLSLAEHGYHVDSVREPLVVKYIDQTESMMTNTNTRIEGVKKFRRKWLPTFKEWFGEDNGIEYADRYFADVIGHLFRENLIAGDYAGCFKAGRSIFSTSDQLTYNIYTILFNTMGAIKDVFKRGLNILNR